MIIYISGPMTGLPDLNRLAFYEAAEMLMEKGHTVINPATYTFPDASYEDYLLFDLECIATSADALYMLKGWEKSSGANREKTLAEKLGRKIFIEGVDNEIL